MEEDTTKTERSRKKPKKRAPRDPAGRRQTIIAAKILCAFMEGAIINSCFMGVPYDRETIQKAVSLILEEDDAAK